MSILDLFTPTQATLPLCELFQPDVERSNSEAELPIFSAGSSILHVHISGRGMSARDNIEYESWRVCKQPILFFAYSTR